MSARRACRNSMRLLSLAPDSSGPAGLVPVGAVAVRPRKEVATMVTIDPPASPVVSERPANPGEMCTCGQAAIKVFIREDGLEVPYCGIPGR